MPELKPLSKEGVASAMEKAERYRVLNEPEEAESICRDVLDIEPNHQKALATLLLALTDQFSQRLFAVFEPAMNVVGRLGSEYERAYYEGIIHERRAKALLDDSSADSEMMAHDAFQQALACFAKAEKLRPPGNEDALLRWNSCVRWITRHKLKAVREDAIEFPVE